MVRDLHIVTFNIPYPPDYGGMIDTYYRIMSLHDLGIRLHLHCFEYGRKHSAELEVLCETICYYPRERGILKQFSKIPYIVLSRKSNRLLMNLLSNDYPILFDGLHTTYYLNHPAFSKRKKLVRLHNIEHKYYSTLAANEPNLLKKIYYKFESAKLRWYENILGKADYILPISGREQEYFNNKYHNSVLIAPSHPFSVTKSLTGTGEYIIYHGDLSVNENASVLNNLISAVFSRIPYKCIIAGKDPPEKIILHASRYTNITVVPNPDNDLMLNLILNAQVNLLPASGNNGFKLKLLMALYAGRHLLVNSTAEQSISIKNLLHVADSGEETVNKIHQLMKKPFTDEMINERQRVLSVYFDNLNNAKKLAELIFNQIAVSSR